MAAVDKDDLRAVDVAFEVADLRKVVDILCQRQSNPRVSQKSRMKTVRPWVRSRLANKEDGHVRDHLAQPLLDDAHL
eukprot:6382742-Prymnesium_polylepis.1